jgi:acylphosphatase
MLRRGMERALRGDIVLGMRRVRAIVNGRVQGVSYRASTAHEARRLGLTGWVKNLDDGAVELEAQGSADAVEQLLAWCKDGPPAAEVTAVRVDELTVALGEREFRITY